MNNSRIPALENKPHDRIRPIGWSLPSHRQPIPIYSGSHRLCMYCHRPVGEERPICVSCVLPPGY